MKYFSKEAFSSRKSSDMFRWKNAVVYLLHRSCWLMNVKICLFLHYLTDCHYQIINLWATGKSISRGMYSINCCVQQKLKK